MTSDAPREDRADGHAETLSLAAAALGIGLDQPEVLGGSSRSIVLRARIPADARTEGSEATITRIYGSEDLAGQTVVVKRFADDPVPPECLRELIGLNHLTHTPAPLAVDLTHGLLVLSDLGTWPTLADLLLGDDPDAAWAGALEWARALGQLTGGSYAAAADIQQRLRDADADPDEENLRAVVTAGLRQLAAFAAGGDPASPPAECDLGEELVADLARVTALLPAGSPDAVGAVAPAGVPSVVWPGDTCPDNAVRTPEGWRFLDLEGTGVTHPALVAAYTVLPFASCWCVFDPPPGFTDELFVEFTEALRSAAPGAVAEPAWSEQVRVGSAAWILVATGFVLDKALEHDRPTSADGRTSPTRRQLLATRWRWGASNLTGTTPAIADACGAAAAWAEDVWGEAAAPPGPYPAFADL